jgi:hypothetical protein
MTGTAREARDILRAVKATLEDATTTDAEQEVQGMALPALDAALAQARDLVPDSTVLSRIADVISPEAIEAGEPVRAVDALLVVNIMFAALKAPPRRATVWSPDVPGGPR